MYESTNILAFMKDNENGKAEVCVVLACTKQENAITSVVKRKCFQSKMKNKHFNQECKLPITNDRALLKLETSNGESHTMEYRPEKGVCELTLKVQHGDCMAIKTEDKHLCTIKFPFEDCHIDKTVDEEAIIPMQIVEGLTADPLPPAPDPDDEQRPMSPTFLPPGPTPSAPLPEGPIFDQQAMPNMAAIHPPVLPLGGAHPSMPMPETYHPNTPSPPVNAPYPMPGVPANGGYPPHVNAGYPPQGVPFNAGYPPQGAQVNGGYHNPGVHVNAPYFVPGAPVNAPYPVPGAPIGFAALGANQYPHY